MSRTFADALTPFVFVDTDVLDANIARMQEKVGGVGLRPHVKSHKLIEIAQRQLDAGAVGLTVAKLAEAAALREAGLDCSIMVAQPFCGEAKARRAIALAEVGELLICVDGIAQAEHVGALAAATDAVLDAIVIVDTGHHRFGADPDKVAGVARHVADHPGLRFRGIRSFAGQLYETTPGEQAAAIAVAEATQMATVASALAETGLAPEIVSIGNTPQVHHLLERGIPDGITEIRAGNYVFNDRMQVALGSAAEERVALRVVATVVSVPAADRAIVDIGIKSLSATQVHDDPSAFQVLSPRGLEVSGIWEECARLELPGPDAVRLGDRIEIRPNHACELANLNATVLWGAGDTIGGAWTPIARGESW